MKTLSRFRLLFPCLLVAALSGHRHAHAQGLVTFNNQSFTLISTNASHGGPAFGPTASYAGNGESQFVYALFAAASSVTSVSGVMDPNWTFTGVYATNIAVAGRLVGGTVILLSPYASGSTWNFLVRGWSSTIAGQDWATVQAFVHNLELDPNVYGLPGQFFGASEIATIIPGGIPTPFVFGSGPGAIPGFVLDQVPVPEPSIFALVAVGGAGLAIFRRRAFRTDNPYRCANEERPKARRGATAK